MTDNVVDFPNKKEERSTEIGPLMFDDFPIRDNSFLLTEGDMNDMIEAYFKNTGVFGRGAEIVEVYGIEYTGPPTEEDSAFYTLHVTYTDLDNSTSRPLLDLGPSSTTLYDKNKMDFKDD